MKAEQIRKMSYEAVENEYFDVMDKITLHAKSGGLSISVVSMTPATIARLKEDGFEICQISATSYSSYTISW